MNIYIQITLTAVLRSACIQPLAYTAYIATARFDLLFRSNCCSTDTFVNASNRCDIYAWYKFANVSLRRAKTSRMRLLQVFIAWLSKGTLHLNGIDYRSTSTSVSRRNEMRQSICLRISLFVGFSLFYIKRQIYAIACYWPLIPILQQTHDVEEKRTWFVVV